MSYSSRNLIEKIWDRHVVSQQPDAPAVLYIDLHLVHEVTSPQAFQGLRERGLKVRRPDRTNATIDHSIPTCWGDSPLSYADELSIRQIHQLEENCSQFKVPLHGLGSERRGIVHIIGPELALTQPGMTIVCGDSHTATHGAFGALAFGIGTSEVEQVLASQSILQQKPKTCLVTIEGELGKGVSAKDVILALIGQIGVNGGTGYVLEYGGSTVRALDMEGRMTLCNMTIEAGARAGLVAPDETTFSYLKNREFAPQGSHWEQAVKDWRTLYSDEGSTYDKTIHLDASGLEPQVTYGTNPSMVIPITGKVPEKANPAALKIYGIKSRAKNPGSEDRCCIPGKLYQRANFRFAPGPLLCSKDEKSPPVCVCWPYPVRKK